MPWNVQIATKEGRMSVHHGGRIRAALPATLVLAALVLTGNRAAAAPSAPARTCTAVGEFEQCVALDATFDRPLTLGGTARLTIRVAPQVDLPSVAIEALLPAGLAWVAAPSDFATGQRRSAAAESGGQYSVASSHRQVRSGKPLIVTGTVLANRTGPLVVSVWLTGRSGHPEESANATVVATVGATRADSYLGYRAGPSSSTLVPDGTPVVSATPNLRYKAVRLTGPATPDSSGKVEPNVLACAVGRWTYQDQTGAFHPQVNVQVQLKANAFPSTATLAVGLTDQNGAYQLCSSNAAHRDIWVQEITDNSKWTVQTDGGDPYVVTTPTIDNVGNGSTTDFGTRFPANPQFMRGMHAFDEANDASSWTPGDCWSPNDHDCKVLHIQWTPTSTDGTFYNTGQDRVHLRAADPDARSVVVHELGHGVMDNAYHDNFPSAEPSCQTHFIERANGPVCGWTEGFADWFQAAVYNDPRFVFVGGATTDLEGPTWGTAGWDNGDTVEGRVAGAMIDLVDSTNERYWDRHAEPSPGPLMQTLFNHRATTFREFWGQRAGDGFDVGPDALAALYQNTIDYDFRDPLPDNTPLTRPTPPSSGHNYQFQTTVVFWSVVAIRPPAGSDYDLTLFEDAGQTRSVGQSVLGPGTIDFVAVDSNHRPLGSYYPRVTAFAGTGEYQIELSQGPRFLQNSEQVTMGAADVVTVRDVCVSAGDQFTLTATPSDPAQNGELFVFADRAADPASWVQSRSQAAVASADHNPGQPATLTFTAPDEACYGVVLDNISGSGTYTLVRS
jgi:hypothetical protein